MEPLVTWLTAQGEMIFLDFVNGARAAGLRPELWLRAKHSGLITTEIREGVHYVRVSEEV